MKMFGRSLRKSVYRGPALASLHQNYAKAHKIDSDAPLISSTSIEISRPVGSVWNAIANPRGWSKWAPRIEVIEVGEVRPDAPFKWRLNGVSIRSTFAVIDWERELAWTGAFLGFHAVERQVLEALPGDHTRITIEESLAGLFLSLFYSSAQLKANHRRWLQALKKFVE